MNTEKKVYTVLEISKILYIGINQAYALVKNNAPFPVIKIRNQFRIPKESFDKWMLNPSVES